MPASFVMGYRGEPVFQQNFVDNPLAIMPPSTIQVYRSEVEYVLGRNGIQYPWSSLPIQQKKQVIREVLLNRGQDARSVAQLEMLSINMPAFNVFEILEDPEEDSRGADFLSLALL